DHELAVDIDDPLTEDILRELGMSVKVSVEIQGALRVKKIRFDLEGRQRQITEIIGDARDVRASDYLGGLPDILHSYFPTGAETLRAEDVARSELQKRYPYPEDWWDHQDEIELANPHEVIKE